MDGGTRSLKHRIHAILVAPFRKFRDPTLAQWHDIHQAHKHHSVWVLHEDYGWIFVLDTRLPSHKRGWVFGFNKDVQPFAFLVEEFPWTTKDPWANNTWQWQDELVDVENPTQHPDPEDIAWEDMQTNSQ